MATAAQQAAVQAAQQKYFDAWAAAQTAQSVWDAQYADIQAAKNYAGDGVQRENLQRANQAAATYQQKLDASGPLQKKAIDAWDLAGKAHNDLLAAIQDSLQSGGAEWIPPNILAPGAKG